ncbi:DUF6502 family protein [Pararoseomonas indoligenes]|uniref:Uncharacterized protein n=1 Tax=Roseomonas indoligenes TaxID=2820811 RepID=A0A940MV49_9PROT|nr:DUF6502 family protein [Pararoseomonas indoligenes]MBP0494014.1 hypothetical protein [Pararoseomonas indoligenes]
MPPSPPPADTLLRPLRRLLRPLVRLLIRAGFTFPVLAELLRGLYVEVAASMAEDARGRTDSRLSLLTGVHRKELRRLRETPREVEEVPAVVTLGSQVIARWLGLPGYADAEGRPLPLPRSAPAGEPSFDALVASVTTDVRPRAVLDGWLEGGVVTAGPDERLRLNVAAYLPSEDLEGRLFYFARNLHDHIAAAGANISAGGMPPFFDRSLHYDRLPPEAAARLEAAGRDGAQRLLLEMNRLALSLLEAGEAGPGEPTRRVNLGIYLYAEDEPRAAPEG